ncbi:hypothetical protein Leryth_001602 [Lithospermum erythrorhizon]|nr:hypothetical protein Leryth_001602 [Lithospermum erythrorhizon]
MFGMALMVEPLARTIAALENLENFLPTWLLSSAFILSDLELREEELVAEETALKENNQDSDSDMPQSLESI